MVIGVLWNKKNRARKSSGNNGSSPRSAGYVIYLDGRNQVVSFKFPERLVHDLDKYAAMLGLRSRSDLIRLLLVGFLRGMGIGEKNGILDESSREKNLKINITIESGEYSVTQIIDVSSIVKGAVNIATMVKNYSKQKQLETSAGEEKPRAFIMF